MSLLCSAGGSSSNKDKVLLKEVTALTLEQGKMTTGRRSSPVQQVSFSLSPSLLPSHIVLILSCAVCVCVQLKCVGGSAGCSYGSQPRVVQCHNRGFDGYDVQVYTHHTPSSQSSSYTPSVVNAYTVGVQG